MREMRESITAKLSIFCICIAYFIVQPCRVDAGLFSGWKKLLPEINLLKADIGKQADALVKVSAEVNNKIDRIEAKVEANAQASAQAIAGVNNRVSNTSEQIGEMRDKITTINTTSSVVNDTDLLKEIFKGIIGVCLAIIGFMKAAMAAKEKHIKALIASNSKKEDKLNEWQGDMIERLTFGQRETDKIIREVENDK